MQHLKLYQKGKIVFLFFAVTAIFTASCGILAYLMMVQLMVQLISYMIISKAMGRISLS